MKRSVFAALLLCGILTAAAPPLTWNFDDGDMPKKQNGAHAVPGPSLTPDGRKTLQLWANYDSDELKLQPVVTFMAPAAVLRKAAALKVSFYCRAEFPGYLELRVTPRNNSGRHLSNTIPAQFTTEWKQISAVLKLNRNKTGEPFVQLPRILLSTVKKDRKIEIGPITVTPLAAGEVSK